MPIRRGPYFANLEESRFANPGGSQFRGVLFFANPEG